VNLAFHPRLLGCHPERSEGSRLALPSTPIDLIAQSRNPFCSPADCELSAVNFPSLVSFCIGTDPLPPRNLCALRVGVYPDPLGAFSFSSSNNSSTAARHFLQTPFPATLTGLSQLAEKPTTLSPVSATLSGLVTPKSFACHSYKKHRGWGIPSSSANSAHSALRPTRPSSRIDLFNATPRTPTLTPLSATLTKNKGEGSGARDTVHGTRATDHDFKMIRWLPQPMATRVPVLIVGAGISGLTCAYYLRKSSIDAQIVEAGPRPGGVIRSERRDGFLFELGPQSFSGTPQLQNLCRDLNIENELIDAPHSAPRFLLIDGQLKPAPLSPPAFFASSLFSAKTKFSILRDLFGRSNPPADDESVAAFTRRKFSAELLDKLVGPFVSGIYAGDPEKLSLRAAFPQLHAAERATGSVIRGMMRAAKSKPGPKQRPTLQSFKEGNETLIKALTANLGPALRCGVEVTAIQRSSADTTQPDKTFVVQTLTEAGDEHIIADRLVLAVPTYVAANLLQTEAASPLGEIEYASLAVVSLGYNKKDVGHSLEGFGFLIPRSENLRTLGAVWNSSLFPGRAPQGSVLLTSFIGGATDPQAVSLSPEEISAIVHREVAPILAIRSQPTFTNVEIYQRALPQYNIGHTSRIANLERESSALLNLKLVGNYLRGPALGACIEQALAVADEIRSAVPAKGSR
jgi:protoporphyrinogen/coproporphyrinogen III oxidase